MNAEVSLSPTTLTEKVKIIKTGIKFWSSVVSVIASGEQTTVLNV